MYYKSRHCGKSYVVIDVVKRLKAIEITVRTQTLHRATLFSIYLGASFHL